MTDFSILYFLLVAIIICSCVMVVGACLLFLIKFYKDIYRFGGDMNIIQFPTPPEMKEIYVMPNGVTLYEKNGNVGTYLELRYA